MFYILLTYITSNKILSYREIAKSWNTEHHMVSTYVNNWTKIEKDFEKRYKYLKKAYIENNKKAVERKSIILKIYDLLQLYLKENFNIPSIISLNWKKTNIEDLGTFSNKNLEKMYNKLKIEYEKKLLRKIIEQLIKKWIDSYTIQKYLQIKNPKENVYNIFNNKMKNISKKLSLAQQLLEKLENWKFTITIKPKINNQNKEKLQNIFNELKSILKQIKNKYKLTNKQIAEHLQTSKDTIWYILRKDFQNIKNLDEKLKLAQQLLKKLENWEFTITIKSKKIDKNLLEKVEQLKTIITELKSKWIKNSNIEEELNTYSWFISKFLNWKISTIKKLDEKLELAKKFLEKVKKSKIKIKIKPDNSKVKQKTKQKTKQEKTRKKTSTTSSISKRTTNEIKPDNYNYNYNNKTKSKSEKISNNDIAKYLNFLNLKRINKNKYQEAIRYFDWLEKFDKKLANSLINHKNIGVSQIILWIKKIPKDQQIYLNIFRKIKNIIEITWNNEKVKEHYIIFLDKLVDFTKKLREKDPIIKKVKEHIIETYNNYTNPNNEIKKIFDKWKNKGFIY